MVTYKITSRDIPLSESMYAAVEEQIQLLQRFFGRILHCEVVLSRPHLHHKKNRFHHVQIRLKTPHKNIIVDREPEKNDRHISFRLALQDAFQAAQRRLEDEVKRVRQMIRHRQKVSQAVPVIAEEENFENEFEYQT